MKYTVWITITIRHTFFDSGRAGLELKETGPAGLFLKRNFILFRKVSPCQWVLLKPESSELVFSSPEEQHFLLDFELVIKSAEFHYFTHWEENHISQKEWNVYTAPDTQKRYLQLPVNTGSAAETKKHRGHFAEP